MISTRRPACSEQQLTPILDRILHEAKAEEKEVRSVLRLMGWEHIPEALILEIKEDIRAFCRELEGQYASCDPFVIRRRRRVDYWVRQYLSGSCTLQTAVDALHVRPLPAVG